MPIYANCGHQLEDKNHLLKYQCEWKVKRMDYAEDRVMNMVKTGTLCPSCKETYRKDGTLLESVEEKEAWLNENFISGCG